MSNKMTICISGKSGCGNSTVSRLVADKLSLVLINYTFRNMAEEQGVEFEEFCRLAQKDKSYDIALDKKQKELAREGNCVLGSRLAIWLLDEAALKVYLSADTDIRAKRIASREGKTFEQVLQETEIRDKRDRERYLNLYHIDNNEYSFADLIINTNRLDQHQVSQIIVDAVRLL